MSFSSSSSPLNGIFRSPSTNKSAASTDNATTSSSSRVCLILLSGAGGGTSGPGGIYPSLVSELCSSSSSFYTFQLDYHHPAQLKECVQETLEAIRFLHHHPQLHITEFVLGSWSFGGAVALQAASLAGRNEDDTGPLVTGVFTVASQTAGAIEPVQSLGHHGDVLGTSCLFIHGTGDRCLSDQCSRTLYRLANEPKKLILFEKDDHGCTQNRKHLIQIICDWCKKVVKEKKEKKTQTEEQ